jgi:PAB1-binding protein PBP1
MSNSTNKVTTKGNGKPATKVAKKKVPKKVARKNAKSTPATKPSAKSSTTKRTRKSNPLYAEVKLGTLKKLLGDKDDVMVTVSRNFILDKKTEQLAAQAADDLGL